MREVGGHDLSEVVEIKMDGVDLVVGGGDGTQILRESINLIKSIARY